MTQTASLRPWQTLPVPSRRVVEGEGLTEGMLVRHASYGAGRITSISGYGAMRTVKVRFTTAGERTFRLDKVQLEVIRKA